MLASEILESNVLAAIAKGIFSILRKERPSKQELEKIRGDLYKLVELAQNTGDAASRFFEVEKDVSRAQVTAAELARFVKNKKTPRSTLSISCRLLLERLSTARNSLHKVRYEEDFDYDAVDNSMNMAIDHTRQCARKLSVNRSTSIDELDHAAKQLDYLDNTICRKRDQILRPLLQAYRTMQKLPEGP